MKKKLLKLISTLSLVLIMAFSPLFGQALYAKSTGETLQLMTRTVKVDDSVVDFESVFNSYEDAKLETEGSLTTFEGKQTIKFSDLEELDEETLSELEGEELKLQYRYSFDYVTDIVTITVISLETSETGEVVENVVDVIDGKAFVNAEGNIDAELDFDGETILLSELQESGVFDNCGWFKKLCKKVTKAVKKAVSTTVGKVVVAATAVTAVAVGVIGAVVAAPAVAVIAVGAAVGAAGMVAATAISSKKTDGSVDWESVAYSAGVGCVAGAILSGAAYGVTKAIINTAKTASTANTANTLTDAQKSALDKVDNVVNNNLKDTDFSGTLRDLNNDPVPNGNGGFFNHKEEMQNSYKALQKAKNSIEGSLKNPNLSSVDRKLLEDGLAKAVKYIQKIEDLFRPFGGI